MNQNSYNGLLDNPERLAEELYRLSAAMDENPYPKGTARHRRFNARMEALMREDETASKQEPDHG